MHYRNSFHRIEHTNFLIIILSLIITIQFPLVLAGVNTSDQDLDGYYSDPPSGIQPDPDDNNPCVPDENTEACRMSKDPVGAINDLKQEITNLISSGSFDINSAQAKALLAKLTKAVSYIESDKINVAINQLNAFNNQINAYINSGDILPEVGQSIISTVNNIIDSL